MATRKDELPEWDDGHTIADMDVPGMPWHTESRQAMFFPKIPGMDKAPKSPFGGEQMTERETRMFTAGALKAALLVVSVLCIGIILFVLFCQFIWFN